MYRAVIVDDEPDVREGLQLLLPWEAEHFKVVGEADNGASALEQMPLWKSDIVITDIRMPVLDGLEYIRRLKEQFPHTLVAVISAHGDFQYAREAIRLGVIDFLLKPVSAEALQTLLIRCREILNERNIRQWNEYEREHIIGEKWLHDICHGKLVSPADYKLVSDLLQDEQESYFYVLLAEMDDYDAYVQKNTERELELMRYMIRNIMEEISDGSLGCKVQVFEDSQQRMGIVIKSTQEQIAGCLLKDSGRQLREALFGYVKIPVSIGIGRGHCGWQGIYKSKTDAFKALEHGIFTGKGQISVYGDLEKQLSMNYEGQPSDYLNVASVLQAVDEVNESRVRHEIDRIFAKSESTALTPERVRGISFEIVMGLAKLIREQNGAAEQVLGAHMREYETVFLKRTMIDLKMWALELCRKTMDYLIKLRTNKLSDVMDEVKQYIEQHYHEDLSLKQIATKVYKNPVYLGQLFKNTFGESFSQYLTHVRIEKAKELLRRDQLRVYEIADKVGYVTLDTFYQRFKQITGMNPSEYKQQFQK